ncbi:glycosyltransferase [Arenicellales bacterium IMCC56312]
MTPPNKKELTIAKRPVVVISHHDADQRYGVMGSSYQAFIAKGAPHAAATLLTLKQSTISFAKNMISTLTHDTVVIINGAYAAIHHNALNTIKYCKKNNIPVIFFWHDGPWIFRILQKTEKKKLVRLRASIADTPCVHWVVSRATMHSLCTLFDVDYDSIIVTGNNFKAADNSATSKRTYAPERPLRIVGAGTISGSSFYRKGADYFCRVAEQLPEIAGQSCEFLWFGGDEEQVNSAGYTVPSNCRFMGFKSNWQDWLSKSDMFLLTSRDEPFGIVAQEALSFDLPVFCFGFTGATDFIENNFVAEKFGEMAPLITQYWDNRSQFPPNYFRKQTEQYRVGNWYSRIANLRLELSQPNTTAVPFASTKKYSLDWITTLKNRAAWNLTVSRTLDGSKQ